MDSNLTQEEIFSVVVHPEYQKIWDKLLEFLTRSRSKLNSIELLNLQIEIANEIIKLEKQITLLASKTDRKTQNNEWFTREVFKAKRRALKQIADGLAWRYLSFNRSVLRRIADHHDTGFLSSGFVKEVEEAKKISTKETEFVLLNDLTNYLRHGDLTVIKPGEVSFAEIKQNNVQSGKRTKQKHILDEMIIQLNKNKFSIGKDTAEVIRIPGKITNFFTEVNRVIKMIKNGEHGFYATKLSPYLWINIVDPTKVLAYRNKTGRALTLPKPPFQKSDFFAPISNFTLFDTFSPSVAPWTIFPFPEEIIIDIILGRLLVFTQIDKKNLSKSFKGKGWNIIFPAKGLWNERKSVKTYEERIRATNDPKYFPKLVSGNFEYHIPWLTLLRIGTEFVSIKTIVNMLEFEKKRLQNDPNKSNQVASYIPEFENEKDQWL